MTSSLVQTCSSVSTQTWLSSVCPCRDCLISHFSALRPLFQRQERFAVPWRAVERTQGWPQKLWRRSDRRSRGNGYPARKTAPYRSYDDS